jgi:uracil-DNA glycosylase
MSEVIIDQSWKNKLAQEFEKTYWQDLTTKVKEEYTLGKVYPNPEDIFRAFNLCPFEEVKVVIIGQDPYHGPRQANGLCFAVHEEIKIPPSLQNIFKEIKSDLGIDPYPSGDLSRWASQGVLLLNAVLTVRAGQPASHKGLGWEIFTDKVIQQLSLKRDGIVYLLWGKYAQEKGIMIDRTKNLVLESAHPSPFSVTKFFGHHHFSQCNQYLEKRGVTPIDWR